MIVKNWPKETVRCEFWTHLSVVDMMTAMSAVYCGDTTRISVSSVIWALG